MKGMRALKRGYHQESGREWRGARPTAVTGRFQIHCPPGPTGLRDTANGSRQELRTRAKSPQGIPTARARGPAAAQLTRFLAVATPDLTEPADGPVHIDTQLLRQLLSVTSILGPSAPQVASPDSPQDALLPRVTARARQSSQSGHRCPTVGTGSIQKALGTGQLRDVAIPPLRPLERSPSTCGVNGIAKSSHGVTHVLVAFSKCDYHFTPQTKDLRPLDWRQTQPLPVSSTEKSEFQNVS